MKNEWLASMRTLLLYLPYILVPLLINVAVGKSNLPKTGITYIFYLIIFLFYPFLTFKVDEYFNPPTTDLTCGMPQFAWILCNWMFVIPVLFIVQAFINRILVRYFN
ncbi:hypothetical protein AHMF7616_04858 [Adhaeribacter pallidiroseus]|uniref:Uncharacterized protein n=1 Tax=Adhaeribacter pallidiroseus TaxID=2072847 RepID=A0A369QSN2_9BACT|nr:hypothetical protein AHMF7616_04858 [Adhaeribacter pallidiroseus]